jgi:hypothetical protein
MRMIKVILCLIAGTLIGCKGNSRQNFPWSLEGKTIPPFTIHDKDDLSMDGFGIYSMSIIVSANLTREQLTLVSQKIIQDQPKHYLVTIFYFSDPKDVEKEFTVGKAWWGVEDPNRIGKNGDYSRHVLNVELAEKSAGSERQANGGEDRI